MEYTLNITCPLCHITQERSSTAPFIYLDAAGIHSHAGHVPGCPATVETAYDVVRRPLEYRALPGDPVPPEAGGEQ